MKNESERAHVEMKMKIKHCKLIKIILALFLCITLIPTNMKAISDITVTETENETITIINSSSLGKDLNQFDFQGKWVYEANPSYTDLYMNDGHYVLASAAGDPAQVYYELKFMGNKVQLYGNQGPVLGIMSVTIDGRDYGKIDLYHPSTKVYQQLIFDSGELSSGEHTVRVSMTNEKNSQATSGNGYIDFAKVYQSKNKTNFSYKLEEGKTFQIPQVPLNDLQSAIWESSDPKVATVKDGLVQAVHEGKAIISVKNTTEEATIGIEVVPSIKDNRKYEFIKINDSVVGTGLEHFQYHGNWGTDQGISSLYQNDGHWAVVPKDDDTRSNYYTLRFTGEKISLYGNKEPVLGIAEVYIDGEYYGIIDAFYENSKAYQQLLFESPLLSNKAEHELKVVMTGKKNEKATKQDGYIDFVEIAKEKTDIFPTSLTIDEDIFVEVGVELTMNVTFAPLETNVRDLQWIISDPSIATMDNSNNMLTALKEGTTTVYAQAEDKDGNKIKSNDCTIQVKKGNPYFHGSYGSTNKTYFLEDYDRLMTEESDLSNTVSAWRNDCVFSEIVLLSKKHEFKNLKVIATDFKDAKGNIIAGENIKPSFIKYTKASPTKGTAGANAVMTPDIIYGDTIDVGEKTVQPVWVEMNIPEDSKAGTYQGTIQIVDQENTIMSFEQNIEVIDLVQPSVEEKGSYYLELWNYVYSSARYYGVEFMSEQHIDILRPHLLQYKKGGGKTVMATIVEEPWNHQTYDDSPSMITWTKKKDGSYSFDYTAFDKYANFVLGEKIAETISCYSIIPRENRITYFDEATQKIVKKSMPVGSDDWTIAWTQFLIDFTKHLEEKDWYDHIWMAMDERGRTEMLGAINLIKSIKNSKGEHFKMSGAFNQVLPDIWDEMYHVSPHLSNTMSYGIDNFRKLANDRREKGLITTIYTCTGSFPNMYNMSHPSEAAWTIWMGESLNTDGFMRWAYDSWVEDPLQDASHSRYETGDLQMVYPGDKALLAKGEIPITRSSPRTQRLEEAIRDVSKLRYLKEKDTTMRDAITSFIRSVKNFNGAARNEATRTAIDAEMDRMKQGVISYSKLYARGDQVGNIASKATIVGTDKDDPRMAMIDGNVKTPYLMDASKEEQRIIFRMNEITDFSRVRIYLDKKTDLSATTLSILDEKNRVIPLTDFKEVEPTSEMEQAYKILEIDYIGYGKEIVMNVHQGNTLTVQEFMMFAADGKDIDKGLMKITASSQETSAEQGFAANMLDEKTNTFWHSKYSGNKDNLPFTIDLDLGESYPIDTFSMLPRQSGENGIITRYTLQVSDTGVEASFVNVVEDGKWGADSSLKTVDVKQKARFIRLIIKEAINDFGSVAELYVKQQIVPEARNLERAEKALKKVEESLHMEDFKKANFYISLLEDSPIKDALQTALNALQLCDKTLLNEAIMQAKEIVKNADRYLHDEHWDTMIEALHNAENTYGSESVKQDQVDRDTDELKLAISQLKQTPSLLRTIVHLEIIKAKAAISSDEFRTLAPKVQSLIQEKCEFAEQVYADANASDEELLDAWFALANALHYLDFVANKDALRSLVDEYKDFDLSGYTKESADVFKAAFAQAERVLVNENALQESINVALQTLESAIKELVEIGNVNKTLLQSVISNITKAIEKDAIYKKDEHWNTLLKTLDDATVVLDDAKATQKQVNDTVLALTEAYENIRLLPSEEQLKLMSDFVSSVKKMNRTLYNEQQVTFIDRVNEQAEAMLEDFDSKKYPALEADMIAANKILASPETVEQQDPNSSMMPNNKGIDHGNTQSNPNTSDATNIAAIAISLILSGYGIYIAQRKRHSKR